MMPLTTLQKYDLICTLQFFLQTCFFPTLPGILSVVLRPIKYLGIVVKLASSPPCRNIFAARAIA